MGDRRISFWGSVVCGVFGGWARWGLMVFDRERGGRGRICRGAAGCLAACWVCGRSLGKFVGFWVGGVGEENGAADVDGMTWPLARWVAAAGARVVRGHAPPRASVTDRGNSSDPAWFHVVFAFKTCPSMTTISVSNPHGWLKDSNGVAEADEGEHSASCLLLRAHAFDPRSRCQ